MADEVEELVEFLADSRAEVRKMALDIVKGLTGSPEGIAKLKGQMAKLLTFLFRLVSDKDDSELALTSLVNLSQDIDMSKKLLEMNVVGRIMDYIRDKTCPHPEFLVMTLANMTVTEQGCTDLLQLGKERMEGLNMAVLLKLFVVGGITAVDDKPDPYAHVAAILTNTTRFKAGRTLLLQPGRGLLQALVSQLQSPNATRRKGAAGAIKNCCMSAEEDGTLQHIVSDEVVLEKIMHPISGGEPKEQDIATREELAEAVQMLARSEEGRKALWRINAPELLKKGYEYEEAPGVCAAMEATARLFMFDQDKMDGITNGTADAPPMLLN